jgi:N,N'-diacetyllegionaminate synthase
VTEWPGKHGVYLIAEIGGNHEGNFEYAQQLAQLACESGVDAVKFQIYTGDTLVSKVESPDRNAHFKRFELLPEQYISLAKQCQELGVTFAASVWDVSAFEWIDPYMEFYKIGSGDLTAYPVLKRVAAIGKPIILSTGLSTLDEIRDAVAYIQSQDPRYRQKEYLAILQCTSMYPIPDEDANLNVMNVLRDEFKVTVGYSNHTVGSDAVEVAVAMGAEILEIHFTDTREGKTFRDHQVSFTSGEIKTLIEKIKKIRTLQGSPVKAPPKSEVEAGHVVSFRRAVYPVRDLSAGTVVTDDDLTTLRPNHGIDARDYDQLIGRILHRDVRAYHRLDWIDFGIKV